MPLRFAFVGFRHGHIFSLYKDALAHPNITIVAACEEDPVSREQLVARGIEATYASYEEMLRAVDCDVIACGDYYSIRGQRLIRALGLGKHVIADKPLCTSLNDLEQIRSLVLTQKRCVGCMLDLGAAASLSAARRLIAEGRIGEVHSVVFLGQHPLLYGKRASWYFEPGKHGGTINDIGIHAIDLIPHLTQRRIVEIAMSRAWNAKCKQHPHFQDAAVFALTLDNEGSVLGDVSYLSSDRHGYTMPSYWRFTIAGSDGVLETSCTDNRVYVWDHVSEEPTVLMATYTPPGSYLDDFLAEIEGCPNENGLTTHRILESSRITLLAQQAADTSTYPVRV